MTTTPWMCRRIQFVDGGQGGIVPAEWSHFWRTLDRAGPWGIASNCLLTRAHQDIRTMYPFGWQCVHECPRSSFWEPRESQTGRGLRALPSTFAPSSTLSSGHLTSCNDQQILLIIKINQTEDWVESKESLLLWHQPTPAFPSLDSALFLFFSSNAFLWQRREGKENS